MHGVDRSISVKRPAAGWNNCRYSDPLPTRGWCQPLADLRLRACSGWHWAGGRNRVRTSDPWVARYAPRLGHRRSPGVACRVWSAGDRWDKVRLWSGLVVSAHHHGLCSGPSMRTSSRMAGGDRPGRSVGCTALRQRVSPVHDHCRAPARARCPCQLARACPGAGHQPRPGPPAIRPRIPSRDRGWPRNSQPRAATFNRRRSAIRAAGHKTGRTPNPGRSGSDHLVGTGQP